MNSKVVVRCYITTAQKLQFRETNFIHIENAIKYVDFDPMPQAHADITKLSAEKDDVLLHDIGGQLFLRSHFLPKHKVFQQYSDQLARVVSELRDEPMVLFRDVVSYKQPHQPRGPVHNHRMILGESGLDKLTIVFVPLCTQNEWTVKIEHDQQLYSPGPRDLMVWDQDVYFVSEPNKTDKLLSAMFFVYNRQSDGDNYEKGHKIAVEKYRAAQQQAAQAKRSVLTDRPNKQKNSQTVQSPFSEVDGLRIPKGLLVHKKAKECFRSQNFSYKKLPALLLFSLTILLANDTLRNDLKEKEEYALGKEFVRDVKKYVGTSIQNPRIKMQEMMSKNNNLIVK